MTFPSATFFSVHCIKVFFLAIAVLVCQTAYAFEVKNLPSHPGAIGMQKAGVMAKAGTALNRALSEHKAHIKAQAKIPFKPSNPFLQYTHGRIVVDAVASQDGNALLGDLKGLGLKQGARAGLIVSGWLPLGVINRAVDLKSLRFISASYRPVTNVGSVTSQGDAAMYADLAREDNIPVLDGVGITVGVLSDSYNQQNGALADVTSGDLPAGINVLDDSADCGAPCTDEGRAMMQIAYDVAPGADLAFHTAFTGMAGFATGIGDLADAGANIIVDDVMYYAEPMFQDGIIAQAADDVVAGGVAYFSSAGNQARDSYEQDYISSGEPLYVTDPGFPPLIDSSTRFVGILHDFDPGDGADWLQSISVDNNACAIITLQWDQPFGSLAGGNGSLIDLDIYLVDGDTSGITILERSDDDNVLGGDPVELFQFCNTSGYSNLNLMITYFFEPDPEGGYDTWEPPVPAYTKYVYFGSMTVNEYASDSGTVYGHANAAGAEATGAAYYVETPRFGTSPPILDYFSSAGGTPILFDTNGNRLSVPEVRNKPGIVAPNGVDTTFFYPTSDRNGNGIPDFSGTSAAAPHAAAVAALMLQANGLATPADIYAALETTAVDMDVEGFDFESGWGLVKADAAVNAIQGINIPPTADFTFVIDNLAVVFTDQSNDPDGTLVSWNWSFGDGNASFEPSPHHLYTVSGTYTVTLTVTDDDNVTNATSTNVTVTEQSNDPPVASFTYSCIGRECFFDGSASSDSDGSIISFQWDFGDGYASSLTNPNHLYTLADTYTVMLTVTDNLSATDNTAQDVTVNDIAQINAPINLTAVANGSGVGLGWEDTSSNEEGFTIQRATKIRGKYDFYGDSSVSYEADSNATSYIDMGVALGTYKYRIRAFAGETFSDWSNEALVKVEETASICGDLVCDPDEDQCNCPEDCDFPPPPEISCFDGLDNDCDGSIDCDDADCFAAGFCSATCLSKGGICTSDSDCCSGDCRGIKCK